eukprot:359006-Chlamydomonas_euryale.AAC.9
MTKPAAVVERDLTRLRFHNMARLSLATVLQVRANLNCRDGCMSLRESGVGLKETITSKHAFYRCCSKASIQLCLVSTRMYTNACSHTSASSCHHQIISNDKDRTPTGVPIGFNRSISSSRSRSSSSRRNASRRDRPSSTWHRQMQDGQVQLRHLFVNDVCAPAQSTPACHAGTFELYRSSRLLYRRLNSLSSFRWPIDGGTLASMLLEQSAIRLVGWQTAGKHFTP